ncbi:DNA repair helicase UVH6 [Durusdinium trenchii]|uniref:DNA repair helicase UVH6 n=1 Tax=Durusdinium trenchii TaxID=1381693 RepID=A0ABP0L397_9DINO
MERTARSRVESDLWLVIASGFEKPVPLIRNGCKEVFLQMASLWPAGAHATLERCVEEEMVSSTRCFCLQLLGELQAANLPFLLRWAAPGNSNDLRATALAELGRSRSSAPEVLELLRTELRTADEQLRCAAITSLLKLEDPRAWQAVCLQGLEDHSSSIVLLSLTSLQDQLPDDEERLCQSVAPLLLHGDAQVRRAASQLLGVLRSALGRTQALKAFAEARCWAQRWREQDEVLAAQAEALQRLEAEEAQ